MKGIIFLIVIIFSNTIYSQKNINDKNSKTIAYLKGNVLLDSNHQVLYNHKGNIVFNKLSIYKNEIALTIDIRKHKTSIYHNIETSPIWIVRNNVIIWKHNRESIEIVNIEILNGHVSFYNIFNDSLIGFIDSENFSELEIGLVFFHMWEALELENIFLNELKQTYSSYSILPEGVLGIIKPVFGDERNVWYWNGKYLYPAYNNDEKFVWAFDGETLKPIWNSKIENEWSWDGEELKPFWGGHPKNNWRWENGIFRQVFENNYKNEYEIVDNIVRKRFGAFGENEWEIEGEIPLPLIGIVLLGIVNR